MDKSIKKLLKIKKYHNPMTDAEFEEARKLSIGLDGYDMSQLLKHTPALDEIIKRDLENDKQII